jgi:hypothetical protein
MMMKRLACGGLECLFQKGMADRLAVGLQLQSAC